MKKLLFSLLAVAVCSISFAQHKADKIAKFKAEVIDFGKLEQNKPQSVTFYVTNISDAPLIIESANPTCGCTIGDYTKAPIAPGKQGVIKATYNAAALGAFDKKLGVKFAGIDEIKNITIKGEVLSPADYAKQKKSGK